MPEAPERLTRALADHYRIERELGQGGMATVYLAEDLKHHRQVALKLLRPELGIVLGVERFLAEVRITAGLDHPHILTLIDSGEADGMVYYVLPFIRGESLRQKLTREAQLSLEETVAITRQIASALDYAHQKGIVHRDLKPENILLHEGEAMLADFGIALAVTEAGGNRLTETGLSLGTPQYMSPEQATGDRQLTPRSDVYSLAAMVYEMVAGEPPVTGPNAQAMIAKLMTERPVSLRVVRDTVPVEFDLAVQKGLAKVPADRFATAGELARALRVTPTAQAVAIEPPTLQTSGRWPRWALLAGGAALLALAFTATRSIRRAAPQLSLGHSEQFTADPGLEIQPAISPDGKLIAYSAGNTQRMRVFIRPVGGGRTIPLSDDSASVETHPRWSPDGTSLLLLTRGGVSVAPALGGSSRPVVPSAIASGLSAVSSPGSVVSAVWSPSGTEIAFARGDSLQVIPIVGGAPRLIGTGVYDLHSCDWSPTGKWIACVSGNSESVFPGQGFGNIAPSTVVLFPVAGGAPIRLLDAQLFGQSPIWTPDGSQLLFISNRNGPRDIYALSVSASGKVSGEPARLTTGLGPISLSLSADGHRLAYAVYSAQANLWSLPVNGATPATSKAATQLTRSHQVVESVRVSSDGRWLLYDSDLKGNADLYRLPIDGGQPEQLTSELADEFAPALSPDGRSVAYHTFRHGTRDIEIKPLNGGAVEAVVTGPGQESFPVWSPDGQALVFWNQISPYAAFIVRRASDGRWLTPQRLVTPGLFPEWSPDGKLIAYATGFPLAPSQLCVIAPTGGQPRCLLEPGPGVQPADRVQWSPDSRTLYYKTHDVAGRTSFWSISVAGGKPHRLIQFEDPNWQSYRPFFATDGKRFFFAVEERESDVFVAEVGVKQRP